MYKMNILLTILIFLFFSCGNTEKKVSNEQNIKNNKTAAVNNRVNDSLIIIKSQDDILFDKGTYISSDNENLLFRIMYPENFDAAKKYPLVIFFHGSGERGDDNEKQLTLGGSLFENKGNREKYPAVVLFPQCPENSKWVDVDWGSESHVMPENPSKEMKLVILLMTKVITAYKIDTARIYVIGLSMGGYGVWDIISRIPYKFAAAVPICGGGDENQANKLTNIPIWAFHGKKDKLVKVTRSRNMIKAIKQAGGDPKYSEFENAGHGVWVNAFDEPNLLNWIFLQKKSN
jgi:predicted peptidase